LNALALNGVYMYQLSFMRFTLPKDNCAAVRIHRFVSQYICVSRKKIKTESTCPVF